MIHGGAAASTRPGFDDFYAAVAPPNQWELWQCTEQYTVLHRAQFFLASGLPHTAQAVRSIEGLRDAYAHFGDPPIPPFFWNHYPVATLGARGGLPLSFRLPRLE